MIRSAFVIVCGALAGAVLAVLIVNTVKDQRAGEQARSDRIGYRSDLRACHRANPLRVVVFRLAAGDDEARELVPMLRSIPGVDPRTGRVPCRAVIPRP